MARSRNYAAEYARRQELARERGFESIYEQRIRGGAGASPEAPRPEGSELARARGHAGPRDLIRELEPESLITIGVNLGELERNDAGNYVEIPITVTDPSGEDSDYWLMDFSDEDLDDLIDELDEYDVDYSPDYDLRKA